MGDSLKEGAFNKPSLFSLRVFHVSPHRVIALLFVSSGQGREYLEIDSLPDRLGKHLPEKVATINV